MTFEEVLAALPGLTKQQQRTVAVALKELGVEAGKSGIHKEDWLLEGLAWELSRRGKIGSPDSRSFHMGQALASYKKKCDDVKATFEKSMGDKAGTQSMFTLGRIIAQCLCERLSYIKGLPVHAVLGNIDRAPEAVEANFPGYLQSGLLRILVK